MAAVAALALLLVPRHGAAEQPGLRHFGFSGGCATEIFLQETAPFSNLCLIDVQDGRLLDRRWVAKVMVRDMKLIVSTHSTFFEPVDGTEQQPQNYNLRAEYRQQWRAAIAGKEPALRALAAFFYVADEPSWNGISRWELAAAHEEITTSLPYATTLTSFSHTIDSDWFEGLEVPTDAVGYHQYGVLDPRTDPLYQSNLDLIKSRAESKGFFYVMDSWWSSEHRDAGLEREDMAEVARNYLLMASADSDAVALVGFHWPALAFGDGARDLPESVRWEYRSMGSEITGKCIAPAFAEPQHALFLMGCEYFATLRYPTSDGLRFAAAMPREHDYGTWVLEEGNVIAGIKVVAGDDLDAFASFYTDLPARIHIYETASGEVVWPPLASSPSVR